MLEDESRTATSRKDEDVENGKQHHDEGNDDVPAEEDEVEEEVQEVEEWREDAQRQLVDRYAEMISTAHEEGCLWRRRGCDGKQCSYMFFPRPSF